jgi:hypothetical protein
MNMKICIFCEKDVEGKEAVRVKEDQIIRSIRRVKKALRIAQMNELYVCKDDVKKHMERRRSFERAMLLASILAGIVILLFISTLILSGKFDLGSFLMVLVIAAFILVFPLPFKYAPALEGVQSPPLFSLSRAKEKEGKEGERKAEGGWKGKDAEAGKDAEVRKRPARAGRKK